MVSDISLIWIQRAFFYYYWPNPRWLTQQKKGNVEEKAEHSTLMPLKWITLYSLAFFYRESANLTVLNSVHWNIEKKTEAYLFIEQQQQQTNKYLQHDHSDTSF